MQNFNSFFWGGGIGLFWTIPKNNPWEWCQKAWRQIWLTYDDRKVRIYCTKCGPNKRQNCRISTVFSEGGIGLFWNIPKNNPREYCQEAWYQIWLTYDDRKVVKSCTNCVRIFVRIRKKTFFTHKNENISKSSRPIVKNSTAIVFFSNSAYNTKFLKKSVENCGIKFYFETPCLTQNP